MGLVRAGTSRRREKKIVCEVPHIMAEVRTKNREAIEIKPAAGQRLSPELTEIKSAGQRASACLAQCSFQPPEA